MVTCLCCKGSKTNTITCIDHTKEGRKEQPPIKVPCFWCDGTGRMTDATADEYRWGEQSWCECGRRRKEAAAKGITIHVGTPSDQIFIEDGPCSYRASCRHHKHHYHCLHCGKVTQIG